MTRGPILAAATLLPIATNLDDGDKLTIFTIHISEDAADNMLEARLRQLARRDERAKWRR